ncbi:MAG: Metallopeptidase family protein, partial [Deltaproteobacteria bacterium]|nr:Metallopeptidase family protein [Deltaproteobacteria bacterium]
PQELAEEIRLTVIHEIAHYFGMDDDEIEDLGY